VFEEYDVGACSFAAFKHRSQDNCEDTEARASPRISTLRGVPTLDAYVEIINEILRTKTALIKKQRLTAKRIFEVLQY